MFTNHAHDDDLVHNKEIEVYSSPDFKVGNDLHYKRQNDEYIVHSGWLHSNNLKVGSRSISSI